MKAFVDKILCVGGVLVLAGSAGWAFTSMGGLASETVASGVDNAPAINVERVDPPSIASAPPVWAEPISQDPEDGRWIYGVFTPPKIYEVDGRFSAEPPTDVPIEGPELIGVRLVEIVQKPYRFQFEGYVEEDASDPRKNLVMLFDSQTGLAIRARVGREFPDAGIRILDIDIQRRLNDEGLLQKVERVKIQEIGSGREIVLEHGVPRLDDDLVIKIQSTETGDVAEIDQNTPAFELNNAEYTVISVNAPEGLITLEKPLNDGEVMTETLTLAQ